MATYKFLKNYGSIVKGQTYELPGEVKKEAFAITIDARELEYLLKTGTVEKHITKAATKNFIENHATAETKKSDKEKKNTTDDNAIKSEE